MTSTVPANYFLDRSLAHPRVSRRKRPTFLDWILSFFPWPIPWLVRASLGSFYAFVSIFTFPLGLVLAYFRQWQLSHDVEVLSTELEDVAQVNWALQREAQQLQAKHMQGQQRLQHLRQQRHGLLEAALNAMQQVHDLRERVEALETQLATSGQSGALQEGAQGSVEAWQYRSLLWSACKANVAVVTVSAAFLLLLLVHSASNAATYHTLRPLLGLLVLVAALNAGRFAALIHSQHHYSGSQGGGTPSSVPTARPHAGPKGVLSIFACDAEGGLWLSLICCSMLGALLPRCWSYLQSLSGGGTPITILPSPHSPSSDIILPE